MTISGNKNIATVIILCIILAVTTLPNTNAQISCNNVYTSLYPCLNFVMSGGAPPPSNCCSGINSLFNAAKSTADRQSVCSCMKGVSTGASADQIGRAASLPGMCGVNLPYKIGPQLDCSKVK